MALNPALETWPEKFGRPLRAFGMDVEDPVIRTQMERGFKARPRFDEAREGYTYQVLMTTEVYHYFRAWFRHKINNGADWFNMLVRQNNVTDYQECRCLSIYKAEPAGDNRHVRVSIQLEARTDDVPSESAFDTWEAS